ncbi:hypothetical protein B0H67DRAFT_595030 [Lasiosphaeris hirsuta]|uniref:Uncharacterized protein n=1 Tax=Lasiosphaeris hirsuta TaxID=260670 RepID=A0AA39ZSD5_9PEZI|nr:hypothetical protein B0H67DRAFT_595030 [Lasiosphaeris hirsuta]
MLFQTAISAAVALFSAHQAMASAVPISQEAAVDVPVNILIATDSYFACNCPNNCSHKQGSSCKYFTGPSNNSPVAKGKCARRDGQLVCIAQ